MVLTGTFKNATKDSSSSLALYSRNELPIFPSGNNFLIDAKELHRRLKIKTKFEDWFNRQIKNYHFEKEIDYFSNLRVRSDGKAGRRVNDYKISIDMAKELCMVERSEIGRKFRRYFIEAEKELRSKRLYAQQTNLTEISKTVKPQILNGRKMFDLRLCQGLLGFSTKGSTGNIRNAGYGGLLVVYNKRAFVAEEYLRVMMASAKTRALRAEAKAAKPVLPENFGQISLFGAHKGGVYGRR